MNTRAYRTEVRIAKDGSLTVEGIPFRAGEEVEVIVLGREQHVMREDRFPLRGTPVQYIDPFDSVAEEDWDALS